MGVTVRFDLLSLVLACVSPLRAQTLAASPDTVTASRASAARAPEASVPGVGAVVQDTASSDVVPPRTIDRRAGAHYSASKQPLVLSAPRNHAGLGQPMALMIVGGAALLAGAIIGGDPGTIIMIGGAVIGLVGLYEYLQ